MKKCSLYRYVVKWPTTYISHKTIILSILNFLLTFYLYQCPFAIAVNCIFPKLHFFLILSLNCGKKTRYIIHSFLFSLSAQNVALILGLDEDFLEVRQPNIFSVWLQPDIQEVQAKGLSNEAIR